MKTLLAQNETHDWSEDTALACWAVNDLTPYQLLFGRRSNYQSDLMSLEMQPIGPMPESHAGYLKELQTRMRELQGIVEEQRTLRRALEAKNHGAKNKQLFLLVPGAFIYVWTMPYKTNLHTTNCKIAFHYTEPIALSENMIKIFGSGTN